MLLTEYIDDLGVHKVAEIYKVSTVTVRSWRDLTSVPSPENANRIYEETHGLVSFEDIYVPYYNAVKENRA